MRLAAQIYCTFGGGGGDSASSTAPVGQHPETDGTTGRNKMRKGGPDKGGVEAGGPGSGCKGPNCGRKKGGSFQEGYRPKGYAEVYLAYRQAQDRYQIAKNGGVGAKEEKAAKRNLLQVTAELGRLMQTPEEAWVRQDMKATSGGQSEGSSLTARKFYVVDGQGRVIHTFQTREEAEQASAGNRYSKVVTHVEQGTPPEAAEVRDMLRKRLVTPIQTFRRTLPYPGSLGGIYPGSPQGR